MQNSETQKLISKIYSAQCQQDFEQSTQLLEQLASSLLDSLGNFSLHPKIQKILQENYEIFPEDYISQPLQNQVVDEGVVQYHKYIEQYCTQPQQEEKKTKKKNPWTETEKKLFKFAIKNCSPKDWRAMAAIIKTRTPQQVRSHFQKFDERKKKKPKTTTKTSND